MSSSRSTPTKGERPLRCFISAPFGRNVDVVIKALTEAGVQSVRVDEIGLGESWVGGIQRNIEQSDFACVVLANGCENSSMLFELGAAVGVGLPILLLVENNVRFPSDLRGLLYIRVSLDKPETVSTAVHGFLRSIRKGDPTREDTEHIPPKRISRSRALIELQSVKRAVGGNRARRFEEFVASLFQKANVQVAAEPGSPDRGVDLAIWLDEVERVLGNPILIELKLRRFSRTDWRDTAEQFRRVLLAANVRYGVLISAEPLPPEVPQVSPEIPTVMTFDIDELISLLAAGSFGKELIRRRNAAVHGRTS